MSRAALLVALAACGGSTPPRAPSPPVAAQPGDLVIADVTVVPMDREGALAHQTVIVRGDRIVAVEPTARITVPAGATRIDGAGKWLMPGLADMHVHTWSEHDLTLFVAAGVTTVRNMFGSPQHLAWREAIAAGTQLGPSIATASPIIDGEPPIWPGSIVLANPADADRIVGELKAQGYDFLKPYSRLSREAYDALVAAGAKHGMALAGHTPPSVGLRHAIASKQRTIEHLDGWLAALLPEGVDVPATGFTAELLPKLDERGIPALVRASAAAGTWNCPTLVVLDRMAALEDLDAARKRARWLPFVAPQIVAQWDPKRDFRLMKKTAADFALMRTTNVIRGRIAAAIANGDGLFVVGTDAGNPFVIPGESMHDELELLVAAGASRARVLRAATAGAAELLGQRGRVGIVAPGARADLLLVDVDPLAAPLPLVPAGVVLRGAWHPRAALEAKLAAIERGYATPASERWKGIPPLAAPGTKRFDAHYDVVQGTATVAEERLVASTVAGGGRVLTAQLVGDLPIHVELAYSIGPAETALAVKLGSGTVKLAGTLERGALVVTGNDGRGAAIALSQPVPAGAFLGGAGIAGSIALAERLAGMAVGERRALVSVELAYFPQPSVQQFTHEVVRKPDIAGNRVFGVTSKDGSTSFTSELVVDPRGGVVSQAFAPPLDFTYRRR